MLVSIFQSTTTLPFDRRPQSTTVISSGYPFNWKLSGPAISVILGFGNKCQLWKKLQAIQPGLYSTSSLKWNPSTITRRVYELDLSLLSCQRYWVSPRLNSNFYWRVLECDGCNFILTPNLFDKLRLVLIDGSFCLWENLKFLSRQPSYF